MGQAVNAEDDAIHTAPYAWSVYLGRAGAGVAADVIGTVEDNHAPHLPQLRPACGRGRIKCEAHATTPSTEWPDFVQTGGA